jgi:hypothetical protein
MRRRKRPRVTSVSFHRVWWAIRREAAFQILIGAAVAFPGGSLRAAIRDAPSDALTAAVARHLAKYPHRRFTT